MVAASYDLLDRPAAYGGVPAFPNGMPLALPSIPDPDAIAEDVKTILTSRMLTNAAYVRELEARTAEYLGVRHCVAVSSCTTGLMLLLRVSGVSGDVVTPSFTFAATTHAVAWNNLRPSFADIDPDTLTMSAESAQEAAGVRASAILATHTFGTPCDIEGLMQVARRNGMRLFFDSAHAFGSLHHGLNVGTFGDAEVFSLTPTKVLVAGEGGIIATNDDMLAERLRIGRDYGHPGDYDCRFVGLNARMSEIHAAIALGSLEGLEERVERRNVLAGVYAKVLRRIPGIRLPKVPAFDRSTYKDFTVVVDEDEFGIDASGLAQALAAEGIETRRYCSPPVHQMQAYRSLKGTSGHLEVTEKIAPQVLTLPMWSEMSDEDAHTVAYVVNRLQRYLGSQSPAIAAAQRAWAG